MEAEEKREKLKRTMKYAAILTVTFILVSIYVTQKTAAQCDYNTVLPWGLHLGGFHVYMPFAFYAWRADPQIHAAIPDILRHNQLWIYLSCFAALIVCVMFERNHKTMSSHGTAGFASEKDISDAKLNAEDSGVVIGRNPYTNQLMLHNGPEHIFLGAPSRSGKGVGIITPTGITWHNSIFFFDPKGEIFNATAGYRKKVLHQKILKFEPLCEDGSSCRWNPYAEIDFMGTNELADVLTINRTMVIKGDAGNKDPFWDNTAISALNAVVLHLLYKNYREGKPLPSPTDTLSYISSPVIDTAHAFAYCKIYPHISPEMFLEQEYTEMEKGENGELIPVTKKHENPLKKLYGEYVEDFTPFINALGLSDEERAKILKLDDLRQAIQKKIDEGMEIKWDAPDISSLQSAQDIKTIIDLADSPFFKLLVHPRIAELSSIITNSPEQTAGSILTTMKEGLSLYTDPIIQKNTSVSDFSFRDLLNPDFETSLYLVLEPPTIDKLRPLTRLFVNAMIDKTVRDMKFDGNNTKQQRLLMMLDEFPQLRKIDTIDNTLSICAGYGVKICIVAQSTSQINQYYTKDNAILDNCHVQVYFAPNKLEAAKELSDRLGNKTILNQTHSRSLFKADNSSQTEGARKLMEPDEVMRMSVNDELVFVAGFRPILAHKIHWFKEDFFLKRVNDPKKQNNPPPLISDICTPITNYDELFAVRALDNAETEEKIARVQAEKDKLSAGDPKDSAPDTEPVTSAPEEDSTAATEADTTDNTVKAVPDIKKSISNPETETNQSSLAKAAAKIIYENQEAEDTFDAFNPVQENGFSLSVEDDSSPGIENAPFYMPYVELDDTDTFEPTGLDDEAETAEIESENAEWKALEAESEDSKNIQVEENNNVSEEKDTVLSENIESEDNIMASETQTPQDTIINTSEPIDEYIPDTEYTNVDGIENIAVLNLLRTKFQPIDKRYTEGESVNIEVVRLIQNIGRESANENNTAEVITSENNEYKDSGEASQSAAAQNNRPEGFREDPRHEDSGSWEELKYSRDVSVNPEAFQMFIENLKSYPEEEAS